MDNDFVIKQPTAYPTLKDGDPVPVYALEKPSMKLEEVTAIRPVNPVDEGTSYREIDTTMNETPVDAIPDMPKVTLTPGIITTAGTTQQPVRQPTPTISTVYKTDKTAVYILIGVIVLLAAFLYYRKK